MHPECRACLWIAISFEAIDLPGIIKVVIQDIERRPQRDQWVDKRQRDPGDKGIVLLPKRLAGLLSITLTPQQRSKHKVNNANDKRNERNGKNSGCRSCDVIAQEVCSLGTHAEKCKQPEGEGKRLAAANDRLHRS